MWNAAQDNLVLETLPATELPNLGARASDKTRAVCLYYSRQEQCVASYRQSQNTFCSAMMFAIPCCARSVRHLRRWVDQTPSLCRPFALLMNFTRSSITTFISVSQAESSVIKVEHWNTFRTHPTEIAAYKLFYRVLQVEWFQPRYHLREGIVSGNHGTRK